MTIVIIRITRTCISGNTHSVFMLIYIYACLYVVFWFLGYLDLASITRGFIVFAVCCCGFCVCVCGAGGGGLLLFFCFVFCFVCLGFLEWFRGGGGGV